MAINVTQLVNQIVQNNPQATAQVQAGASTASAMFSAFESGGVNASTVLTLTNNLPPGVQANINNAVGSITANLGTPSAAPGQQAKSQSNNVGIEEARKQAFGQGAPRSLLDDPAAPI
jgi:hypothetical protein